MQREEKHLEMTLDAILSRLNELRNSIGQMINKMDTEYEYMNWPTFLDNFALISSHLTGLSKVLSKEIGPPLRNRTVLPLMISPERDEALINLTQGRIQVFSHDIVPDYLRTKPDPLAEQKMMQNEQKAALISVEQAMKQVTQFNKVVTHILDMVSKAREDWEVETSSRAIGIPQTSSMADTHALIAAIGMGKGLKMTMPMNVPGAGPGGMMVPPAIRTPAPMNVSPGGVGQLGKAPSALKTNIKPALQVHPFSR